MKQPYIYIPQAAKYPGAGAPGRVPLYGFVGSFRYRPVQEGNDLRPGAAVIRGEKLIGLAGGHAGCRRPPD